MRKLSIPHVEKKVFLSPFFLDTLRLLGHKFAIITDDKVGSLHGKKLLDQLQKSNLKAEVFIFKSGEENKTRHTKELIEDAMQAASFGKDSCIIALGGGVVSDLAGFIASTYCRGLSYVVIPTTLLGMVDASIGGKNGVNTPFGKNLVGSFYPPNAIFFDPEFLATLPEFELRNGITEMIKHGIVADEKHFKNLESDESLESLILESSAVKLRIIQEDPFESGLRRILNFGHTIGHALEIVSKHRISHGEAVAIGMIIESYFSWKLGYLPFESFKRIEKLIKRYHPNLNCSFDLGAVIEAMLMDKKSVKGMPRFVLIKEIGAVMSFEGAYCREVPEFGVRELKEAVLQLGLRSSF